MPIDIHYLRDRNLTLATLRASESKRNRTSDSVERAVECDIAWRQLRKQCDKLRSTRKLLTKAIRDKLKSNRKDEAKEDIRQSKELNSEVIQLEKQASITKVQLDEALLSIGNPLISPAYSEVVHFTSEDTAPTSKRHTLQSNEFTTALLAQLISFLKQHTFSAVALALSPLQGKLVRVMQGGLLLQAYSSVWIPESALPLRYVVLNSSTNSLELSVLCQEEQHAADTFKQTVALLSEFMRDYCCRWKVDSITLPNLPLEAVQHTMFSSSLSTKTKTTPDTFPIVQCYNYTDYHSRAAEVRCGHVKKNRGVAAVGGTKRYVHLVHCVLSLDALSLCLTADKAETLRVLQQAETREKNSSDHTSSNHTTLFEPLVLMKTGGTPAPAHSAKQQSTQNRNKKRKNTNKNRNGNGSTMHQSSTTMERQRSATRAPPVKLCTQQGIDTLVVLLNRQSFVCGAGWVAMHEDAVVFVRLTAFMNYIAQVELHNFINVVKALHHTILSHTKYSTVPTGPQKDQFVYNAPLDQIWRDENSSVLSLLSELKNVLAAQGVLGLETCLGTACRTLKAKSKLLKAAGIKFSSTCRVLTHAPTHEALWFSGQRAFWRWYRCLNRMKKSEREDWLPSDAHLKSGRVSMLFDL